MIRSFSLTFLLVSELLILSIPTPLTAQQPRVLTYEDAITIALEKSYTVKSHQADLKNYQHWYEYRLPQFKPRIDFSMFAPAMTEYVAPIERVDDLPVYNSTGIIKSGGELRFTYMLQFEIVYNVTNGFYSLYRSIREVEIAQEKLKNSEEAYRIAGLKYGSGRIAEGEVLEAEVYMSNDRATLLEKEGRLSKEKDSFKQLIGLEPDDDFRIETDLLYETFTVDVDRAVNAAMKNKLELGENELDIKLQEIRIDRAKREREFEGKISAYYDLTGVSTLDNGSTRSLFESSFDNFIDRPPNRGITLTFSYPVFDWGRGVARVKAETVNLKKRKLEREDRERTIVRSVKDVCRRVEETKARLIIQEKNQDIARRSYDINLMRFENGDISSQELARSQETLAETQLAYLNAFIAYQSSVADLKKQTLWDFRNNRSYIIETTTEKRDK